MKLKTKILTIVSSSILATGLPAVILTGCAKKEDSSNTFNLNHYYINPLLDNMETLTVSNQPVELTYGQQYIFNINLANWNGQKPESKTKWAFSIIKIVQDHNPESVPFDLGSIKVEINNEQLTKGTDFAINDHTITGLERSEYFQIGWDAKIKITATITQQSPETNDDKANCFPSLHCSSAQPTPVTDECNLDYFDDDYPGLVSGSAKQAKWLNIGTKYKFKANMADWVGEKPEGGINWSFTFLETLYYWMPLKIIDMSNISIKLNNTPLTQNVDYVLLEDKSAIIGKGQHEKLNYTDVIEIETKVKHYINNNEKIICYPILTRLEDKFTLSEFKTKQIVGGSLTGLTVESGGAFLIPNREYTFEMNTSKWDIDERRESGNFKWAFALINSPLQEILPLNTDDGQSSLTIDNEPMTYHTHYEINKVPVVQGNGHMIVGIGENATIDYNTSIKIKVKITAPSAVYCVYPILYDIGQ